MTSNRKKAFTLIELLVVVAIISVLSSVILGALNESRSKARDQALFQTIKQIQNALELYKSKFDEYPNPVANKTYYTNLQSDGSWWGAGGPNSSISLGAILSSNGFLSKISPPKTGVIAFYNYQDTAGSQRVKCSNQQDEAPYIITFQPETNIFDGLPGAMTKYNGVWSSLPSTIKCVSIY